MENKNFTLDQTILDLENVAQEAAETRWKNHHISKIGRLISLFNGAAKKEINAIKLFEETMANIVKHIITDLKVPDLETYYVYYENRFYPIYTMMYPFAPKMDINKLRKAFEKQYSKGKINYHLDENNNFIID